VIVVDCSYMLALVLRDGTRPASHPQAQGARLFVPAIWPLEVANALRNVVRRGRLSDEDVPAVCARIESYAVEVVGGVDVGVRHHYAAALHHDLTPYDATYLELALARRSALATLDANLAAAARRNGIAIFD
jgi:predicted nucleic acid-binding protein